VPSSSSSPAKTVRPVPGAAAGPSCGATTPGSVRGPGSGTDMVWERRGEGGL
jgi:hypothetical protein